MGIESANNIIIREKPIKKRSGGWYMRMEDLRQIPKDEVVYHNPNFVDHYKVKKDGTLEKLFNTKSQYLSDMANLDNE
jgi:hypothetical protein